MIEEKEYDSQISSYQPSQEVIDLTCYVKKDYAEGMRILNKPWTELNDRSILDDDNRGKMMFNAYVDLSYEDPNESWKWRGTRSMARNKGIAMHAQLTANYLLPLFIAQNENDEVDRDFSEVMREIIEWMTEPTNSDYQSSFLQVAFGMMQNPVTYMGAEYYEIFQKIKEMTANGKYEIKEVLDTILSGFKAPIWSANQVLITNAYERNIQRQRRIIKRRWVEYDEMKAKYGHHRNWGFVQKGIKSIYNDYDGLFYDIFDRDHMTLVTEEIALCRRDDSEIPFVNGIYMGEDDVENGNPIKHRDNRNAPKYNVVPFGYMRIGEHFFYYKSMMNALGWDNMAYDAMSEIVFNRAILENEMPIAITGSDEINSSVIFPNSVVSLEDKDARVTGLLPPSNMVDGFNALRETEKSMADGSLSDVSSGQLPDADQKAYSIKIAQANAKKNLTAIGKSLGESVTLYGDLMKDIALNHVTVAQVEELTGGVLKMKYPTFMLANKTSGGKMGDRIIRFDESLIGLELSTEDKTKRELQLLEASGYPYITKSLRLVNPELFAKFNYLTKVDIQEMFNKSGEYWQPILMQLKTLLANDPYIDQEGLDRKLLYSIFMSEGDALMKKQPMQMPGMPPAGGQPLPGGQPQPQPQFNNAQPNTGLM